MKLSNAAKFFDRDSVYDAYTGLLLYKAQYASFEGAAPDGSFSRRRTVSIAPEVTPAPRGVVRVQNELWINGNFIGDSFFDKTIRRTASAKAVTDMFQFLTPGQAALASTPTKTAYGQARYLKDTVNTQTNANYGGQYELAFSPSEEVSDEMFLKDSSKLYHVRVVTKELEGFYMATADEVEDYARGEDPLATVMFAGAFDPINETTVPGITTTGVLMYAYKVYNYETQADPTNVPGDRFLFVAKSAVTAVTGTTVTINGDPYRVHGVQGYFDSWKLKVRRA